MKFRNKNLSLMRKLNYILFSKYFTGTASQEEMIELEMWLKSDTDNKIYFDNFNKKWKENNTKLVSNLVCNDTNVWKNVFSKIQKEDNLN
ncbi:MAG: hypothetical protein KA313_00065 [Pseudarcicella sp.]|nr:hypothetical protein [Pseudarcicella sp.]